MLQKLPWEGLSKETPLSTPTLEELKGLETKKEQLVNATAKAHHAAHMWQLSSRIRYSCSMLAMSDAGG